MARDDEYAATSRARTHTEPMSADSPVISTRTEKLRSLIQVEVDKAVETTQREERWDVSRKLVEKNHCDVFFKRYCAATDNIKSSFFSIVESVFTEMIYCQVLGDNRSQNFGCWSHSDTFM